MRAILLSLSLLCGCAWWNGAASVQRDAAPPEVAAAEKHVVAIFTGVGCKDIAGAKSRGNGFYVNDKTVATVWHFNHEGDPLFPKYAVVGLDGCHDAQYADQRPEVDLMFLRVRGHHGPGAKLSKDKAKPGELVYAYSFQPDWMEYTEPASKERPFRRWSQVVTPMPREFAGQAHETIRFASKPVARFGDSGSPVVNLKGEITGMAQSIYTPKGEKEMVTFSLHAWIIQVMLEQCGPCEED